MKIILSAINSRYSHTAIALAYLKAHWENNPKRPPAIIQEYDINQTNEGILADLILAEPDILAFSVYIWSLDRVLGVASAVKAALPYCKIILGGPEVSWSAKTILTQNPFIDFIVRGEGEKTFSNLLGAIATNTSPERIAGISLIHNGEYLHNPDTTFIRDLDSIPSPFQLDLINENKGFTYYEASRGCHSACDYCLSSVQGPVRYHSLERVKKDLDWFFNSDFRQIRFMDRTFNCNKARAIEIIEYIQKNNHKQINFHFEIQADFLSDNIIDLLAKSPEGMFHLEIGVQSTNPHCLQAVKRRFNLEPLFNKVRKLKEKTGCHLHLDLLGGLPFDSFADFCKSLDDIWLLKPHSLQISLVKVLRGTPLQKSCDKHDIFCMAKPPYTVLRSRWLSAPEAILITDISKLVEGIYNSGRFGLTLDYIVKNLFNNSAAGFLEKLAHCWRQNKWQFYNFTPENISNNLEQFIKCIVTTEKQKDLLTMLLEHELHLCQKVPAGENNLGPNANTGKPRTIYKVIPGLKSFWYKYDLDQLLNDSEPELAGAFPSLYQFERDLSSKPHNGLLELDLAQRFVIACLKRKITNDCFADHWQKCIPSKYKVPDFDLVIEKLLKKGLLYNPRQNSYKQVKELIDKTRNLNQP
jgi:radical SAM superfamily enzyme YgiQ (UPF0313 family)